MSMDTMTVSTKKSRVGKAALGMLILFLMVYHVLKLYNIHWGDDFMQSQEFIESFRPGFSIGGIMLFQSILRVLILLSLTWTLVGRASGLIGMWISILALIALQFYMVTGTEHVEIHNMFAGLRPLKGVILPSLITLLYRYTR